MPFARALLPVAAIACALHAAFVLAGGGERPTAAALAVALAGGLVWAMARRGSPPWTALAAGIVLYAVAQVFLAFATSRGHADELMSAANVPWLAVYPLGLVAVAAALGERRAPVAWDARLDGAVAGLTLASLGMLVGSAALFDPPGVTGHHATILAFAVGDFLVLGLAVGSCSLHGWRPPRRLLALIVAFAALAAADAIFLHDVLHAPSSPAPEVAAGWLLAMLVALAVIASPRTVAPRRTAEVRIAWPLAFGLVAVVLALALAPAHPTQIFSVTLAGMALLALLARLAWTVRRQHALLADTEVSQARLAAVQRVAGLGSWEWHFDDDRIVCSDELLHMLGCGDEALFTVSDAVELVDPEDRPKVAEAVEAVRAAGRPLRVDYRVTGPNGVRVIHCQGEVRRDEHGRPVALLGATQDITDRVRRIEAERANTAKAEFLSRMSHELRTPLNAILGFGQLLDSGTLEPRQSRQVHHILSAGRHLLALINDVLEISRVEADGEVIAVEPVDVARVVEEAIEMLAPLAAQRGVSISCDGLAPATRVHADCRRLRQVVLNLLSNAIKYGRKAGRVEVRSLDDGDRVRIVVADDGPGVPPEQIPRLFRPFERLGAERSAVEGTGLGLAVSKALVEGMCGTIAVESRPGAGTTVSVELRSAMPEEASGS